jgi:hypothetical protein
VIQLAYFSIIRIAKLVRLSSMSIADEMRQEHTRRMLGK